MYNARSVWNTRDDGQEIEWCDGCSHSFGPVGGRVVLAVSFRSFFLFYLLFNRINSRAVVIHRTFNASIGYSDSPAIHLCPSVGTVVVFLFSASPLFLFFRSFIFHSPPIALFHSFLFFSHYYVAFKKRRRRSSRETFLRFLFPAP